MKLRLFIFSLLVSITVFAQTHERVIIPGTKFSMIPPTGFELATNFSGFQHKIAGASIMITEVPAPVESINESFTAVALQEKGMTLIGKEIIDYNHQKATFIKISQPANGLVYLKQVLVFGDTHATVMVNGIYKESSTELEEPIKSALLSTVFDEKQHDDPMAIAGFSIDLTGTGFQYTRFMSGSFLYTLDGQLPTKSTDKAMLIVGNSLGEIQTTDQQQYCMDRLKKLPRGETIIIKEKKPITAAGLKGFEIVGEGKDNADKKQLVYQVILFKENGEYYIILGSATAVAAPYLAKFRKVVKTFQYRQ